MTALARSRSTPFAGLVPARGTFGAAASAAKIFSGAIVCLDAAGRAIKGNTIANGAVAAAGKASADFDNSAGAADAIDVEVEYGVHRFANSAGGDAIATKNRYQDCYVVDDQTVALTDGGNARVKAGKIIEVDSQGVWVLMGPLATLFDITLSAASSPPPVDAVSIVNQATLTGLAQTVDGVALSAVGMRVLLTNQTTGAQNGPWLVQSGAWIRPPEFFTGDVAVKGYRVLVKPGGTSNFQQFGGEWMVTAVSGGGVVDTDTPTFYPRVVKGQIALSSGTPSTATVTNIFVLSNTTSSCSLTEVTNQANNTLKGVLTAGTPGTGQLAITGAATNTDTISYLVTNW
jgi:hypothetical protein